MKTRYKIIILIAVISVVLVASAFVWQEYKNSPSNYYYGGITLSENDKLCSSTWTIRGVTMEHNKIEKVIRAEIGKFGEPYDHPDREITVNSLNSHIISVEIVGSWRVNSDDRPNLGSVLSNLGQVDDMIMSMCA